MFRILVQNKGFLMDSTDRERPGYILRLVRKGLRRVSPLIGLKAQL
jgi:hypothetical protein